jgi:D-alanyl-D-alanine carboxypeptidase
VPVFTKRRPNPRWRGAAGAGIQVKGAKLKGASRLQVGRARYWLRGAAAALVLCAAGSATAGVVRQTGDPYGPYVLVDAATGAVIDHFEARRPWYPASTTKLMTLYVTFRAIAAGQLRLDSPVTVSANSAAQPSSKMGFGAGVRLTLADALKMMMVKSANDIAVAVAETVGGSVEAFAERMNREAARLGMSRSHFVNPHGLPDERQVTSARDMAVLARALLTEFPQHRDFLKVHAIRLGDTVLRNFNSLLVRYPGANGMKTGFICASGYNLVASARRGEREVIAVVFGAYGGLERAEFAAKLLDKGFATGAARGSGPTLATVTSGERYDEPLDMRPFVCSPDRAAAASEANTDGSGKPGEEVSRLTPPVYLGPPQEVAVIDPKAAPGELGFEPRIPRPRPGGEDVADAFVPVRPDGGAGHAPSEAIGDSLGDAAPLGELDRR